MRDNAVERLLSLFTSSGHAVAIAGDLAEEREQRGSIWFWLHVVLVTLAFWRSAAVEAPLRLLALVLSGIVLLATAAFIGVAALFIFPPWTDSPVGWIAIAFVWWAGAFWTGASLVALGPRLGMTASAMLALGGAALLITFGGPAVWREPANTNLVRFFVIGMMAAMPLLTGSAVARRRIVVNAHPV